MLSKFYDGVYLRGEILRNIKAVYDSSMTLSLFNYDKMLQIKFVIS